MARPNEYMPISPLPTRPGQATSGEQSARAPCARAPHAGDLAGLLHVAVGEQLEKLLLRVPAHAFGQVLDDEAGIGGDLVFVVILAHEADGVPVVVVEF